MDELSKFSKKVRKLHIESHHLAEGLLAGDYKAIFKGQGLEFNEVREYIQGDDARFIDWNVSSRMGMPYSKTFKEEREMTLELLVDTSASLHGGYNGEKKSDLVSQVFILLALAAASNNDKVGSITFSSEINRSIKPIKGKKYIFHQVKEVLESTSKPDQKGSDLSLALKTVEESVKQRGIIVIISDFLTSNYKRDLIILSQKHDVIAIRIYDPEERKFPPLGLVDLKDVESDEVVTVSGKSKKLQRDYEDFWEVHRLQWLKTCHSSKVNTLEISVEDNPFDKLHYLFKRRKR